MPRLRLKTKLVLAITAMVMVIVATLSYVYVSQLVRQRIQQSFESADFVAHQVLTSARQALEIDLSSTNIDLNDPNQVRGAAEEILQADPGLNSLLQSIIGYSPTIYDVSLVGRDGNALVHSDATLLGKTMPTRPNLTHLRDGKFTGQIRAIYGEPTVYEVRLPVQRSGSPFGEIRVGVSTVFLKSELQPLVDRAVIFSAGAILLSLLLAAGLSNLALQPLEAIGRRLDAMTAGAETPQEPDPHKDADEFGVVSTKIDRLGRQMRDVKEVFSALKENLDQIMSTLQDGLILFTKDGRIVLVSASAERFVGKPRGEMLGNTVEQVFDDSTFLGQIVLDAFALHQAVPEREIELERGRRIELSLDFIAEHGEQLGALLTMRDAESVRRIENEIELSRRLAAIGRLTSGVAHEVKNPINAIVVHLEVLREKLLNLDPETKRHMDVIESEIHRLDRVVKTLVDFTRPVELKLAELDLREIVDDVVALAAPDAERQGVNLLAELDSDPLMVRVDADMVKQALLNVVLNGVQAMPDGGPLNVIADRVGQTARIIVRDHGVGIPPEVRDKIFNLYFTTKKKGSGIGLAMTYRVMQLHNGALEFDSTPGEGTRFRLLLPMLEAETKQSVDATGTQAAT